ncbi:DUF6518 family protein [Salinibacterium xinjiangense]|uniref:DUF6518 family protein n=1 Tax=Salinibacterium xinjiangense TaxID=386302 RepID=UPI003D071405
MTRSSGASARKRSSARCSTSGPVWGRLTSLGQTYLQEQLVQVTNCYSVWLIVSYFVAQCGAGVGVIPGEDYEDDIASRAHSGDFDAMLLECEP